jgi:hypothetical protein
MLTLLTILCKCRSVIFAALIVLSINGCSWLIPTAATHTVIDGKAQYPLLSSAVFPNSMSVTQSVTILSGKDKQTFLLQTEVDPNSLTMVAMTGFGQKLFELQYIQNRLIINKTPFLPAALVPETLFADFQLMYWPSEPLHNMLANSHIKLLEPSVLPQQRVFQQAGATIIEILYHPRRGIENTVTYKNLEHNYSIQVDVLDTKVP